METHALHRFTNVLTVYSLKFNIGILWCVLAPEIDPNIGLGAIFHNIFMMIFNTNNFYDLKFGDELNDMYRRFIPQLVREAFF